MVKRLRWWHRKRTWQGHAGWVYTWSRPNWVGRLASQDEPIWLRPDLDTANYGPYRRLT